MHLVVETLEDHQNKREDERELFSNRRHDGSGDAVFIIAAMSPMFTQLRK